MDVAFLSSTVVPVVVGICLCCGYIIKTSIPKISNQHIPLIMGVLGLAINISINQCISAEIVLGGLFSGLASTGLYEVFRNLINSGGSSK